MKKIKTIGIIGGTNGIGAVMADFWKINYPSLKILISGRKTELSTKELIKSSDLVIFSVPINKTLQVIRENLQHAQSGQIWSDFTSVKKNIVEELGKQNKADVCGLHPLFGPLKNISGQRFIVCPGRISQENLQQVKNLLQDFEIITETPEDHDKIMGVVQNVSHFSDLAMGSALRKSGISMQKIKDYSTAPYRLKIMIAGRMLSGNSDLYTDISIHNEFGKKFTKIFTDAVNDLQIEIEQENKEELAIEFEKIKEFFEDEFCRNSLQKSDEIISGFFPVKKITSKNKEIKKAEIAIFGEQFSHTDEASSLFSKRDKSVIYFKNIFDVFLAIENGQCKYGIIPYENSINGPVLDTMDELFSYKKINILEMQEKKIAQNLLATKEISLLEIKSINSHPQAIAQSKKWIRKNCPQASLYPRSSTVAGAKHILRDLVKKEVCIGSVWLAEQLELEIIAKNISPEKNITKFILIGKDEPKLSNKNISIVFQLKNNNSGGLVDVLNFIKKQQINLLRIDSRRNIDGDGEYLFFIDAEISLEKWEEISSEFSEIVADFRVLGSF